MLTVTHVTAFKLRRLPSVNLRGNRLHKNIRKRKKKKSTTDVLRQNNLISSPSKMVGKKNDRYMSTDTSKDSNKGNERT